jgi:hypothetical protein
MDLQPGNAYAGRAPAGSTDTRRLVRARLAVKRRRTRRIRQAVLGVSIAVFVAMFATIYVQLASGNDPALSASSKAAQVTAVTKTSKQAAAKKATAPSTGSSEASSSKASTSEASTSEAASSESSSSNASSTEASSTPSTVTTSQS